MSVNGGDSKLLRRIAIPTAVQLERRRSLLPCALLKAMNNGKSEV